jgi:hypothetical protein
MTDAQKHFKLVFGTLKQKPIIQMWPEYEVLLGYPDDPQKNQHKNKLYPQHVYDWMQRHCIWGKVPLIDNASEFEALWKGWWSVLQLDWHVIDSWLLSHEGPVKESWHDLMKSRGNGFVLILLSLLWWMMREKDKMWVVESSVAFEDVE